MSKIDRKTVKRLSRTMNWYGNHWKVGDVFSEQRAADCGRAADTLLTLIAALDAAEARERAAVAAAYEGAERRARYYERIVSRSERAAYGLGRAEAADAIRALSDTDALAEYVEKVRAEERERCAKIAEETSSPYDWDDTSKTAVHDDTCEAIAAAVREEGG
jgi:hypothetical protein